MSSADPKNLAVLISGGGSNLQSLIDGCAAANIGGEISLVISNNPDAYGLERAKAAGIPTAVIDHRAFDTRDSFDSALVAALEDAGAELVILAGFMRILTPNFIRAFEGRLLNIHPSLLPKYPGLDTHQRALDAGDSHAGATVHFVTEELDGGPPIIQVQVPIEEGDDAKSLALRVLEQEHKIYPLAVQWFCADRLRLDENSILLDDTPLPPTGFHYAD